MRGIPDEYQHVQGQLVSRLSKMKKIIIALAIIGLVLLVTTIVLGVQHQAGDLSSQNADLKAQNERLLLQNKQTDQQVGQLDQSNSDLQQSITELNASISATGKQIDELQTTIKQNCDITRQKLLFNQTNVNAFTLSIPPARQAGLPSIASLNLMRNNLSKFCDNSLPDLQTLDLRYNRLLNMSYNYLPRLNELKDEPYMYNWKLREFSGNVLPLITELDLSYNQIGSFRDNVMPQLRKLNLDSNNLSALVNCTFESLETLKNEYYGNFNFINNSFPKLTNISNTLRTTVMTGNLFGQIQEMNFYSGDRKQINFEYNKLPGLIELAMSGITYDMAKIVTNDMPKLTLLDLRACNITNFKYYGELRMLSELRVDFVQLGTFSNHEYPTMTVLSLTDSKITQFANNKLPALEELIITSSQAADICSGNLMLGLKKLIVQGVQSFTDKNYCLSKFEALQILEVSFPTLPYFRNYNMPQLQSLNLQAAFGEPQVLSFQKNNLPKLKYLTLKVDGDVDLQPYEKNLEELLLSGPLKAFKGYYFDNLKKLRLNILKEANTSFTNCRFPVLEELYLANFNISFSANTFSSRLRFIAISNGYSEFTLDKSFDSSLEVFTMQQTTMRKFNDHTMPNLTEIYITGAYLNEFSNNILPKVTDVTLKYNQLSTMDCRNMPAVRYLELNDNMLMDGFVDVVISCNLNNLSQLYMRNNRIMDTKKAYDNLMAKYPNIQLQL